MTDLSVFLIFFSVIVQCFVARLGYNFIVGCYSQQTQCLVARRRRINCQRPAAITCSRRAWPGPSGHHESLDIDGLID